MNPYSRMKKKWQKNKKTIKKKVVTAAELFAASTLLTAGGNMVDKLSEDSSPHITASEVTWNQDQGKALFEIKQSKETPESLDGGSEDTLCWPWE